jgi:hypothetical protein
MTSSQRGPRPTSGPQKDSETQAQQLAVLADKMRELFAAAIERVGPAEAISLWTQTLKEPRRKRGRPPRSVLSGWDALLLEIYDKLVNDPRPETLPRHLGIIFCQNSRRFQSPQAVERKLRRLLAERKAGKLIREKREGIAIPRYRLSLRGQ